MAKLKIKSKSSCMWDLVSLGEVMLRLDPGDERIATTRHFRVWEGGGEYNVARGLRRCFGMDTAVVTALCGQSCWTSCGRPDAPGRHWTEVCAMGSF